MKNAIAFALMLTISQLANAQPAPTPKMLLGDCTYVSLNNTLRFAHTNKEIAYVQISPKSFEQKTGTEKIQVVVTQWFDASNKPLLEMGFSFKLDDPSNGFCTLGDNSDDITVFTAQELAALSVLPNEDAAPGTPGRYLSECNTAALNLALKEAASKGIKNVLIGGNSSRLRVSEEQRVYDIYLASGNTAPISSNPGRSLLTGVAQPGDVLVKINTRKTETGCEATK